MELNIYNLSKVYNPHFYNPHFYNLMDIYVTYVCQNIDLSGL